jgi:tRNA threonylcarbamoyladenosine biosynthesis protein TsaE
MVTVRARSAAALRQRGRIWAGRLGDVPAVLLDGPLGAGKTTLVQGFLAGLGVAEAVKSPTFDLVHPYRLPDGRAAYHVDLFRLDPVPLPEELGIEDPDALVLVEWGRPWAPYYPDRWEITLDVLPNGERTVTVEARGRVASPNPTGSEAGKGRRNG